MRPNLMSISFCLGICLTFFMACGLWVGSPKKPTDSTPQEQKPAPLVTTPKAAVAFIETATKSAGISIKSLSAGSASLLGDGEIIDGCAASNEPVASDSTKNVAQDENGVAVLPDSDPGYALAKFYCLIAANSGDEGSILGAFDTPKLITCLVGDKITYDGKEHISEITVAGNPCFTGNNPDGLPAVLQVRTVANNPAVGAGPGWDSSLDMTVQEGDSPVAGIKMFVKSDATQVAIAFQGGGTATDAYSFNLDLIEGTLRYEGKFLRIPKSNYSDHTRILIKGTIEETGNFSDVNAIEGVRSSIYNVANTSMINGANVITIRGTSVNGYRTFGYKCNTICDGQNIVSYQSIIGTGQCAGGAKGSDDATCKDNTGIQIEKPADLSFLMRPAEPGFEPADTWISKLSPLKYEKVELTQDQE